MVYNAFTTPYRDTTADPRLLVGVVMHADSAADPATATERPPRYGPISRHVSAANSEESYGCALAVLDALELCACMERGVTASARTSAPRIAEQVSTAVRTKRGMGDEVIEKWVMSSEL